MDFISERLRLCVFLQTACLNKVFKLGLATTLSFSLLLGGCANNAKKEEEKKAAEEAAAEAQAAEAVEEVFVPLPNPYLLNPVAVPAQAKAEFERVKVAVENKNWERAYELLSLMIEVFPDLSGPYVNTGIVSIKLNNLEEAENAFKFAIEKNQYNFDAYDHLGVLYRQQGRFAEAEEVYLKALALWPHHLASNKNLGVLYDLYMGRFDDALKYYEMAQKIGNDEDRQLKGWIVDLKRRMANK